MWAHVRVLNRKREQRVLPVQLSARPSHAAISFGLQTQSTVNGIEPGKRWYARARASDRRVFQRAQRTASNALSHTHQRYSAGK